MPSNGTDFLLQVLGVFFILAGLSGITGIWKGWYWRSRNSIYGYLPFGLLFILTSFERYIRALFPTNTWVLIVIYTLLLGLGIWGFIRPPRFIKPRWVRLIEAQPPAVYQAMVREVRSGTEWKSRVASEDALQEWIRSVRKSWMKPKK